MILFTGQELPEGEWFCEDDCKSIDNILTQLVGNGTESLSDSNICEFLESRQQQGGVHSLENSESSRPSYEWQILCGKAGSSDNVQTLADTVNLFTVCVVLAVNALQFVIMNVFDLSVSVIVLEVLLCFYIFLVKLLHACVTEDVLLPLLLAIEATCLFCFAGLLGSNQGPQDRTEFNTSIGAQVCLS